jgi:cytochrome P450
LLFQIKLVPLRLGGRAPTFKDVQDGRLPYTQRVVKESLRKYAPINLFPRLVENDDVLPSGHKVSPGDFILLSSWAMGRNPKIWDNPNEFDPDRFTEENLRAQAGLHSLPGVVRLVTCVTRTRLMGCTHSRGVSG